MPRPTEESSLGLFAKLVEHVLRTVTNDNDYFFNGLLVDRDGDPRLLRQNKPDEYERYAAAVTIGDISRVIDPRASLNGRVRWNCSYPIYAMCSLTVADDKNHVPTATEVRRLKDLVGELQDDIWRVIRANYSLQAAATALSLTRPLVTHHRVVQFQAGSQLLWPDAHFIAQCEFILDEFEGRRP
jgi:hypothetical protein